MLQDGRGYITTHTLKEILHEIDQDLTDEELDLIIDEVDENGSGNLNFERRDQIVAIFSEWIFGCPAAQ